MTYFFAFLGAAAIAVSFRMPLSVVPAAGLAGVLGWLGYYGLTQYFGASPMLSAFVGALLVGTAGEVFARRLRQPTTMFIVPGLFPLLPGLMAYTGMLHLAREEMVAAGQMLARAAFYAGALAAGLALPPAIMRRRH